MLEVSVALLSHARANSGLSCKDSAALVYAASRNWYAWEDGQAKMPPAIFELFLVKTGQKELKSGLRAAGKLEQRDTPPGAAVIKLSRNAAELTQAQAAQLVYVTPGAWQKWELGKAKMHPAMWELFLLKTGWVLSEPEPEPEPELAQVPAEPLLLQPTAIECAMSACEVGNYDKAIAFALIEIAAQLKEIDRSLCAN